MDIADIAKLAGVSPSTVSKIINHKDASISRKTRERIQKIVRECHYTPYARVHATKDWLIGVLFRSPISLDSTLDGIVSVAQSHGYAALVYNSNANMEQEEKNVAAVVGTGVTGIVWEPVSQGSLDRKAQLESSGAELITIGPNGGDLSLLLPYEKAAFDITSELVRRHHTRIACLTREGRRTEDFIHGFKRCLFENGLAFQQSLLVGDDCDALVAKVSTGDVTAVACSHYQIARMLLAKLSRLHYHAPEDVSIVSLRNDTGSSWTEDTDGSISTFTIRNSDFGRFICRRLIAQIERCDIEEGFDLTFRLDNEASLGYPPSAQTQKVIVVGSINIDTRLSMPTLPDTGITVSSDQSMVCAGGKGTNQAIGAARLGHRVTLIGDVGSDSFSDVVYQELEANGVDTAGVYRRADAETGKAYIFVNHKGESMITLLAGANARLNARDIISREQLFEGARYCLVQTEVPMDAVRAACETAHRHGAKTVLKPAACISLPDDVIRLVDILVPNERELTNICPEAEDIESRARFLLQRGAGVVIVTRGAEGCLVCLPDREIRCPGVRLRSVDATGAEDAFISALTSCLLHDENIELATSKAIYAAACCTMRKGVSQALIDRYTLDHEVMPTSTVVRLRT